jgi:hypothetical protein
MSAQAVRVLVAALDRRECYPFELTSTEDLRIGHCLHDVDVNPRDTRDGAGKERW